MSVFGPSSARGPLTPFGHGGAIGGPENGGTLADVLERVLDKGIVIAGDIQVNLLDIELLTIKLRLVVASVETARRMGIRWWESDPMLTGVDGADERKSLQERVEHLEHQLEQRSGSGQGQG